MVVLGNALLTRTRDVLHELCAHLALQEGPAAYIGCLRGAHYVCADVDERAEHALRGREPEGV